MSRKKFYSSSIIVLEEKIDNDQRFSIMFSESALKQTDDGVKYNILQVIEIRVKKHNWAKFWF